MKKSLRKFRPSVDRLEGRMLLDSATGATASQATGTVPLVSAPASAPGGSDLLLVANNGDFHLGLITTPPVPAPAAGGSDPTAALLVVNNGNGGLSPITTPPAPASAPGPGTPPVPAMGQGPGPTAATGTTPGQATGTGTTVSAPGPGTQPVPAMGQGPVSTTATGTTASAATGTAAGQATGTGTIVPAPGPGTQPVPAMGQGPVPTGSGAVPTNPNYSVTLQGSFLAVTAAPVVPPVALTPSQRDVIFATTLYRDILGRDPDASGLNFWVNHLLAGTSQNQVALGFWNSPEHRTLLRQHRAPQISFQSALANASRAASNAAPADPDPAPPVALTPSQRNTAFVTTLYRDVLGRDPDAGGLNFWVNRLVAGTSRDQVALGFWNSVERRALMKRHRAPQISLGSALTDASRAANNA